MYSVILPSTNELVAVVVQCLLIKRKVQSEVCVGLEKSTISGALRFCGFRWCFSSKILLVFLFVVQFNV